MGTVRIHYEISDELHRRAKAEAARQGITLKALIEKSLRYVVGDERADEFAALCRDGVDHAEIARTHGLTTKKIVTVLASEGYGYRGWKPEYERNCDQCGRQFKPHDQRCTGPNRNAAPQLRYCSNECRRSAGVW